MREIKFRGKDIKTRQWVYGYYLGSASAFIAVDEGLVDGAWDLHKVIPETVGQFTGLKDKNGKEIYEGDVFRKEPEKWLFAWKWKEKYARFCPDRNHSFIATVSKEMAENIEIIGNIHDNPELIHDQKAEVEQ